VRSLVAQFGFTAHIRARGEEAMALKKQAGFKARRWVVEVVFTQLTKANVLAFGSGG
jgi:hypothetical protein